MFYLFVTYLESLGDRVNPITLRDLRWLRRRYLMDVLAVLFVIGTVALFFVTDLSMFAGSSTDRAMVLAVVPPYMMLFTIILTVGWPLLCMVRARSTDELLGLVPLTPKQQVHGYLGTSVLSIGFFTLLLLPFNIAAVLAGPLPVWFLAIPPGFFLVGVLVMLYTLSFMARTRKVWEVIVLLFVAYYFGTAAVQIPIMIGIFIWGFAFGFPDLFEHLSLLILLSTCAVAAMVSFVYLGYRLSLHQFGRKSMTPWSGAANSTLAYAMWSVFWTALALLISMVYFHVAGTFSIRLM